MKQARLLAGLLLVLLGAPSQAREWVVVGAAFPRIYERNAQGDFTGLATEILERFAAARGDRVRFLLHPWSRAQRMAIRGEADILVGPYATLERRQRLGYSRLPFYRDLIQLYGRADRPLDWRGDYRRLDGLRVAVVRGWTYGERFRAESGRLQPARVGSVANGLRMLDAGRIDLLAANARHIEDDLPALGLAGRVTPLSPPLDIQDGYFAFFRDPEHDALRDAFDLAFARLREDGGLARLAERLGVTVP